jgi:formate--tetrahydrofolate ligase
MAYNAVEMADWQISEAAEKNMPTPMNGGEKTGSAKRRNAAHGPAGQTRFSQDHRSPERQTRRQVHRSDRHHPDPLGEGKSTTSCG